MYTFAHCPSDETTGILNGKEETAMSMSIAKIKIKPDKIEDFKRYVTDLATPTRQESGCLFYYLYQMTVDLATFFFIEEWESQDQLDKHLHSPHVAQFEKKMEGITEGPVEPFSWVKVV